MPIYELIIRNFDSTNPDPDHDRMGCRKRGMCDAVMPDGHPWGSQECLPKFVIIKCDLTVAELAAYEGMRKVWRDIFDYEITTQNANQGWYDVRIFETAAGVSSQNAITGAKATKIQGYLTRWGCINITAGTNQIAFRFRLSAAVQSQEFWDVSVEQLSAITFVIDSYTNGVGTITTTFNSDVLPMRGVRNKIVERGGVIVSLSEGNPASYTFTIERGAILTNFRSDIKRKAEQVYMYQQHRISTKVMDQIETAGGVATLTKAQLVSAIRDMAAE